MLTKLISAAEAEKLGNFPLRSKLLETINAQNGYIYDRDNAIKRLTTRDELFKKPALRSIPTQTLAALLDLYSESGRLVAIPLFNEEITYVLPSNVKKVLKEISQQVFSEHSKKHPGSGASLDHIANKYSNYALDQLGSDLLGQTIRAYVALRDYNPDPIVMRADHAKNLQAREMKILSKLIAPEQKDIVMINTPTQATAPKVSPRAAEQPNWIDLKEKYKNEPMFTILKKAIKILGVETIVRIALREESYADLQNLIKAGLIYKKEHLEIVVEILRIIESRNNINPHLKSQHQALWDFTEKKIKAQSHPVATVKAPVSLDPVQKLEELSRGINQVLIIQKNRQIQMVKALELVPSEMLAAFTQFLKRAQVRIDGRSQQQAFLEHMLEEHFALKPSQAITPQLTIVDYPQNKDQDFLIEKVKKLSDAEKMMVVFENPQFQVNSNLLASTIHESQIISEFPEKLLLTLHWVFCEEYCQKHGLDFTTSFLGFDPQILKNTQVARQQPKVEHSKTLTVQQLESLENPIIQMAARMKSRSFTKDLLAEKLFEVVLNNLKRGQNQMNFLRVSQHAFKYLLNLERRIANTPGNHQDKLDFIDALKSGLITFWMRIIFSPECRHWDTKERGKFVRSLIPYGQHIFNQFNKYENYVRSQVNRKYSFEYLEDVFKILEEFNLEPVPSLN